MPQLLTSTIGGVPVAWDISANYLDVSNNLNVNGNTSVVGNVITSNITGFANQSYLVRISGNLIIPLGITSVGIAQDNYDTIHQQVQYNFTMVQYGLRYNKSRLIERFYINNKPLSIIIIINLLILLYRMPQLLTSTILWDISANYLDVSNNLNVNGNTSLVGNVTTSNITGFAGQSSLVRISGNLIIPSGVTDANIGAGQLRFNPTLFVLQFYNGTAWVSLGFTPPTIFEYLVIAGGGGGGQGSTGTGNGGAGGAGGYRNSVSGELTGGGGTAETPITITPSVIFTIVVGLGGASNTSGGDSTISGSTITTITSTGGGFGGGASNGGNGGSSGGGRGGGGISVNAGIRTSTTIQGFNGANGEGVAPFRGGGGGGAGEAGNTDGVGDGGDGLFSSINGTSTQRGGGGSGGSIGSVTTAGAGGGGTGAIDNPPGFGGAGTNGTGGGGGGGYYDNYNLGGAGGSGIVIIRTSDTGSTGTITGGGTLTTITGYKVYTFLTNGTILW